jgi:CO/xanthine dehydrogenase Mo-binding subunit
MQKPKASAKQGREAALQEARVPPKNRLPEGRRPARRGPPQAEGGAGPLRVVEEVARISDFRRKHAAYEAMRKQRRLPALPSRPLRGIGLAVCYQGIGLNGESVDGRRVSVRCRLDVDQRLDILTSIVDIGQGSRELFIRIAARILDIDAQRIAVHPVDTREVPDSGPTSTLRTMAVIGGLLEKCCQSIRRKRLTGSLPIDVRCSHAAPRGYEWDPRTRQGGPGQWYSWAGTIVDLEIDPVTLQGSCRGIWLAIDAGRILDPELARLQAEGAILQALGCAALEAEELTHGRPDHYADHGVAGFLDIPPIEIHFLDPGPNPDAGGLRELGDLPFLGMAPAYASATVQATGCAVDRLPMTPEAIQACLEADGR